MANLRKKAIAVLKVVVSLALVYFIFTKVDLSQVVQIIKKTNPLFLLLAFLFFVLSKIISALRLNLYFHQIRIRLTQVSNLKLYLLGMFYNLFLPGGIGGDAYKGYVIKKKFEVATKRVISVLVLDRLSGLLLLFVYACFLAFVVDDLSLPIDRYIFLLGAILAVSFFWFINRKFFRDVFPVFWKSVGYSALVQLAQLICVYFILCAFALENQTLPYMLIFLLSSIASVIPVTIGGVGSREVIFYYGASWLNLNLDASIGISITFFFITALTSICGVLYHFRKPELKIAPNTIEV